MRNKSKDLKISDLFSEKNDPKMRVKNSQTFQEKKIKKKHYILPTKLVFKTMSKILKKYLRRNSILAK